MRDADTIIVGGGPAGSSCAWRLKQRGHDALILDQMSFPRVKLCAGWITQKVLDDLDFVTGDYPHSLQELDARVHLPPLPFALNWFPTSHRNYSIRRIEFDNWLLERAGVPVVEHRAKHIERVDEFYVLDNSFRCRNLVGAGGTACPVRRAFFPDTHQRASQIVTLEQEFDYPDRQDNCHLYFAYRGLKGYAWYVPKADGAVNIGLGGKAKYFKRSGTNIHEHLRAFVLRLVREGRLDQATADAVSYTGHPYYLASYHGEVQKDRCYLIGDSAGLATVDLGEGIGPAVESGLLAAHAILGEADYARAGFTTHSFGGPVGKSARWLLPVRR
ncbi:MAG: NAD(P)/FAD-dependent oxidoreductase [Gammaproteobacteria bacterium]|nr:NAD(P)/FAD-dependent oxidoreductase [Gammaproteobacteria bacterium]